MVLVRKDCAAIPCIHDSGAEDMYAYAIARTKNIPLLTISCYMHPGDDDLNIRTQHGISSLVHKLNMPFLCGGDANKNPYDMGGSERGLVSIILAS